jgi:hypothetical protein
MSKSSARDFLKKNSPNWFSVDEIAAAVDIGRGVCSTNLKKLREENNPEIISKEIIVFKGCQSYRRLVYRWRRR